MNNQRDETVIDEYFASLFDDIDNVWIVDVDDVLVAVLSKLVVNADLDLFAPDELDLSSSALKYHNQI